MTGDPLYYTFDGGSVHVSPCDGAISWSLSCYWDHWPDLRADGEATTTQDALGAALALVRAEYEKMWAHEVRAHERRMAELAKILGGEA